MTSGSSASEKPTLARAVKCFNPKYTASAPASMAARSWGQYPAGLMTSGLRRGPMGTPSSVAHASTLRRVPTDPRETATAFRVLAAISFCHLLNDMMQSVIPAVYPILKNTYPLDFRQIGLITLTSQLTASLLQPLVGLYTDRHPTPYSLPAGMTFTMVGLILIASAPSFAMVLAAVALVGVGSAVFHPESSRVARMASGGQHGLAQSLFQVGGNAGSSLGPLLAAFIVLPAGQRSIAWFSLAALVAIAVLLRVGAWYQRHPSMTPKSRAMRVTQSHLPRRQIAWAMAVLIALIFSKYFYLASVVSYYTFYLIHKFHVSVQTAQVHLRGLHRDVELVDQVEGVIAHHARQVEILGEDERDQNRHGPRNLAARQVRLRHAHGARFRRHAGMALVPCAHAQQHHDGDERRQGKPRDAALPGGQHDERRQQRP